ncbi:MarR family transcriptional regulator [Martelella alba]|uniref:MarR family transcriptional regulator n=2 Tax=Martelella alba TaxID=2590451 RepID=A0A506UD28_9HYPH|nr:MarR family transcriptional regulator [Martelella alba]
MKTTQQDSATGPSDDILREFIGYNMKRAFLLIRDDMRRVLEPLGLKIMDFSVLSVVVENPDISQTQLSQVLKLERSGMVVLVDALEDAELISRNRVPGDRRTYALRATPKGRRLFEKARQTVRDHETALFAGTLDENEQDLLRDLLRRIGTGP